MSLFASNPNFCPTEITGFIRSLDSGAGTLLVDTDAGLGYLKALGNHEGPQVLACDLVGTHLAAKLDLPTFDYALVEVLEMDELPFFRGGHADPGPAFITRAENGSTWGNDRRLLARIVNSADVSRLVALDTWLRNLDRHGPGGYRVNLDNVFFSTEVDSDGVLLRAMDLSHAITNGRPLTRRVRDIENIKDGRVYGLFPEFKRLLEREVIRDVCESLGNLPAAEIEETVALIPPQWDVDPDARRALVDFLRQRASFVAVTLENALFDPPQLTFATQAGGDS